MRDGPRLHPLDGLLVFDRYLDDAADVAKRDTIEAGGAVARFFPVVPQSFHAHQKAKRQPRRTGVSA